MWTHYICISLHTAVNTNIIRNKINFASAALTNKAGLNLKLLLFIKNKVKLNVIVKSNDVGGLYLRVQLHEAISSPHLPPSKKFYEKRIPKSFAKDYEQLYVQLAYIKEKRCHHLQTEQFTSSILQEWSGRTTREYVLETGLDTTSKLFGSVIISLNIR